jgi:hypothetical protein
MSDNPSYITNILNMLGIVNQTQLLLIALFIIIIMNLFYVSDANVLESRSQAIIITLVTVVVVASLYKMVTGGKGKDWVITAITVVTIIVFLFGGVILEFYEKYIKRTALFNSISDNANGKLITNIIQISLIISIIIVGISAANNVIGRYLVNSTSWTGFILNLIVYIPCLFEDLIKYVKQEYGLTSSVTFILLAVELLLITAYVSLPMILSSKLKSGSTEVMNEPEFLDIAVSKTFVKEDVGEYESKRTNYAFSMWVYLNQQNNSSDNNHIFSYGGTYPKIEYVKCKSETNKDKYRFTIGTDVYDINMPNQKWNNIVINFNNNNTVDVFVNGNLERTFESRRRNITSNVTQNTINIGSNNGLYGAICNINYYAIPLTQGQIVQQYNLLYNKNPPTNNIM